VTPAVLCPIFSGLTLQDQQVVRKGWRVTHPYRRAQICDQLRRISVCVSGIPAAGDALRSDIDRYPDLFVCGLKDFSASFCTQKNMSFAYQGLTDVGNTTCGKWNIVYVDSSGFSASLYCRPVLDEYIRYRNRIFVWKFFSKSGGLFLPSIRGLFLTSAEVDKLKPTDFKTEVLFDLVDSLYQQNHGLTVTSNYSMRDLVERERLHPAIVRRLDDMCRIVEM
jgi:hypothetical protein